MSAGTYSRVCWAGIPVGLVLWATMVAAQVPVLSYDWATDPVTANRNFSRIWTNGVNVTRVIPFSDTAPLSPPANYTGPLFYGAASYLATGTVDGTTPVAITGTPAARVSQATSGDEIYANISSSTITNGGYLGVEGAVLYYFKTNTPFQVGDTSLRWTSGTYANLSRFQWVLRNAAGNFFISDMNIRIPNTGTTFYSNNLTTRRWALFDPTQENLFTAAGDYRPAGEVGLDFAQITGAGVLITASSTRTNSGNRNLNASIRKFDVFAHDPARDAAQLSAFYFGNSLTESTAPNSHPALGASTGKLWEFSKNVGAGWQLWQHRYVLYVGGNLDPGSTGDYTIDPGAISDSATVIQEFVSRPWEAMVLQPFGSVMWTEVVTQRWDVVFPEPTDVGDPQSATDLIAVYLTYNPAGKVCVYPTWHGMPYDVVPPKDQWPEWTQYYPGTNNLVVGQTDNEFPDRDAFVFDTRYFDFYQSENPPWINNRNGTRDYEHKLFAELIARHPQLWAQGRLTLIPIRTIFRRLHQIYAGGGDPELNNPAVPEKITRIADFYTDSLHVRAGLAQFTAAASFYTALFGAHPGTLDWTIYNIPTDYPSDPYHDRFPTLQITADRAAQVCDIIWDEFRRHPFSVLRESPFPATASGAPDTAHLWGANGFGQIGKENQPAIVSTPEPLAGNIEIIPGPDYAFALKPDGSVLGWGRNHRGQLGDATFVGRAFPYPVVLLPPARQLAPGRNHVAAVTQAGEVWAWGANDDGQLGDDFGRNGHTIGGFPVPPENGRPRLVAGLPASAVSVACGTNFTVACFTDGTVWSWGRGQSTPAQVTGLPAIAAVTAGDGFTLARAINGTVWAWGANDRGQLGLGDTTDRATPVQITDLSGMSNLVAGAAHALAVTTNGTLYVWGDNTAGQLGQPGTHTSPVVLDLGIAVREVAAGAAHSAARLADRSLWTWGANEDGQLGDGTTVSRSTPQQVLDRVASVRAAGNQTSALTAPPRPTFAAWQAEQFSAVEIAGGQAAAGFDFDGDGQVNLLEYIQLTNPRAGDGAPQWACRLDGGQFVFETEYLAADTGVAISWETSTDLVHWSPAVPASAEYYPNDDRQRVVLRFATGPAVDRLFLRLRVQQTGPP